jgi:predicted dehydrogenase
VGGHLSHLDIDVEDVSSALLECAAAGRPLPVHLQQDYLQRPPSRTLQVVGDAGKLLVDLRALTVRVYDASGQVRHAHSFPEFQRNELFLTELRCFLTAMQGQPTPLVTVRADLATLRTALAIKTSLETRQSVATY